MDDVRVYSGFLLADLVLSYARDLKQRRKPLQALIQKLHNHQYSVAQVGPTDLHQRAFLAVGMISGSENQLERLLDGAERIIFASEFEVADLQRDITVFTTHSS